MILSTTISNVISNTKRVVKVFVFGKSDVRTATQYAPSGIDSAPQPKMKAIYATTSRSTEPTVIGYINESVVEDGEIRIFSLDSELNTLAFVKCDKDGNVQLNGNTDYAVAFSKLKTEFNKLQNAWDTFATTYVPGGPASVGLPATALSSNANIDNVKVDTVKLP